MGRRQVSCPGQPRLANLPGAEYWACLDDTGQKDSFLPTKSYLSSCLLKERSPCLASALVTNWSVRFAQHCRSQLQ